MLKAARKGHQEQSEYAEVESRIEQAIVGSLISSKERASVAGLGVLPPRRMLAQPPISGSVVEF